jgi:hypothetical protein
MHVQAERPASYDEPGTCPYDTTKHTQVQLRKTACGPDAKVAHGPTQAAALVFLVMLQVRMKCCQGERARNSTQRQRVLKHGAGRSDGEDNTPACWWRHHPPWGGTPR